MKYRLTNFCNKRHKEEWEIFSAFPPENWMPGSVAVALWHQMIALFVETRKVHHICIWCAQKLPRARQSTI